MICKMYRKIMKNKFPISTNGIEEYCKIVCYYNSEINRQKKIEINPSKTNRFYIYKESCMNYFDKFSTSYFSTRAII